MKNHLPNRRRQNIAQLDAMEAWDTSDTWMDTPLKDKIATLRDVVAQDAQNSKAKEALAGCLLYDKILDSDLYQ